MPGHQDRVADQARDQEPRRAHEGRADADGLHERLERLPPGHPSSPFTRDGSRRPPVPGLADRELPLPGEPGSGPSPALDGESRPSSAAGGDTARIGADGAWEWKGRHLTPEQSRIADQALSRCLAAEGRDPDGNYTDRGLTPAMRRIEAQLEHGHLVEGTERFALKSPDRFKEKLAGTIADEPGCDAHEVSSRISDGIRYTYIFADEEYAACAMDTCDALAATGFGLYERKNAWADETKSYQGINTTWIDHSSGTLFEVQLHTRASWAAKQASHRAYEVIAAKSSTPEERMLAHKEQQNIFKQVPIPPGVKEIPSHRKEGW